MVQIRNVPIEIHRLLKARAAIEGMSMSDYVLREIRKALDRHAHEPLLDRVWALRKNLTAYDAVYVALAEALDAILLTCDVRLARAPGIGKRVELVHG